MESRRAGVLDAELVEDQDQTASAGLVAYTSVAAVLAVLEWGAGEPIGAAQPKKTTAGIGGGSPAGLPPKEASQPA
ncbi:hypothetical protein [Streptomyces sp. NPDC059564]|uniref:hypothetical protein n=1 Tax=Streptomyces sp. NPDC059564 TaxID=3346865 RepID=UPI003690356E